MQPLLWAEFRKLLQHEDIRFQDVCTPHTFVNLALNRENQSISLIPQSIVDFSRSIVLFDRQRKVQAVFDPTDFAVQKSLASNQGIADQLYGEARLGSEQGASPQSIREKVHAALQANPKGVSQQIVDEWLGAHPDLENAYRKLDAAAMN